MQIYETTNNILNIKRVNVSETDDSQMSGKFYLSSGLILISNAFKIIIILQGEIQFFFILILSELMDIF